MRGWEEFHKYLAEAGGLNDNDDLNDNTLSFKLFHSPPSLSFSYAVWLS